LVLFFMLTDTFGFNYSSRHNLTPIYSMRKNTNNPKNENICGNIKKVNTQLIPQFLIFFHLALNITSPPKREIISQPRSHEEREKKVFL